MGKRKRQENEDYVDFCSGLQKVGTHFNGDTSYIYSKSRDFKRPKINPNYSTPASVRYRYVNPQENVYKTIKRLIKNNRIEIEEILQVYNPTLEEAFDKKKREKIAQHGKDLQEIFAFHGTKECNIDSICKFNFDWRLNGSNKGHKFGKGVCFSKSATYASNYSDHNTYSKVMIVAKVLIAKVCQGYHDMSIPPLGYDTSQKGDNGSVLVKYEDNEFFPAYVVQYHFAEYQNARAKRNANSENYYTPYQYILPLYHHKTYNTNCYYNDDRCGYNHFQREIPVNYPSLYDNRPCYNNYDYSVDYYDYGQYYGFNGYYPFY